MCLSRMTVHITTTHARMELTSHVEHRSCSLAGMTQTSENLSPLICDTTIRLTAEDH